MTFFAWTRSVSFHVVFKDILRYGSTSISSYKEYNFTISTHIISPIKSRDELSMTSFAFTKDTADEN